VANTLTALIPTVVATLMRVKRTTGAIFNAINTDLSDTPAAHNQTIKVGRLVAAASGAVTPGPVPPAHIDVVEPEVALVMDQYQRSAFHVTAEEWVAIGRHGPEWRSKRIDAAVAKLLDDCAASVAAKAAAAGSLAYGAEGTTPFASNAKIIADLMEGLDHLRAPQSDRYLIMNSLAKRNMFQLDNFIKLNEAPEGLSFAQGTMRELGGLILGMDQSIASKTKGVITTAYAVNGEHLPGVTSITLKTGVGPILAGDVIHFGATPAFKYVVETGRDGAGAIVLRTPLREVVAADAVVYTSGGVRNFACHRDAMALAIRPPAEAPDGDSADDVEVVTDPDTGLSLRLASYGGYHARQYELSVLYGSVVVDNDLLVPLLG